MAIRSLTLLRLQCRKRSIVCELLLSWALSDLVSSHASIYLCVASSSPNCLIVDGLDVKYKHVFPSSQRRSSLSEISLPNGPQWLPWMIWWMPRRYDARKSTLPVSRAVRRRYRKSTIPSVYNARPLAEPRDWEC